jgi:hypothetical protein
MLMPAGEICPGTAHAGDTGIVQAQVALGTLSIRDPNGHRRGPTPVLQDQPNRRWME